MRRRFLSVGGGIIEHMFDSVLPGPEVLGDLDDAALIDALKDWDRAVNAAEARRLAVVAEMGRRSQKYSHLTRCAVDDWDAVTAQISCALNMGHGRAETLLDTAVLLFPFAAGVATWWRTVGPKVARLPNHSVVQIPHAPVQQLAQTVDRRVSAQVMVMEGQVTMTVGGIDATFPPEPLM